VQALSAAAPMMVEKIPIFRREFMVDTPKFGFYEW